MRILALESSGLRGSVAVADDQQLIAAGEVPAHQRMAQGLAPAIASALARAGWRPADVQLVAVTVGPGSFTGLRVGLATAKTFAYATRAAVLGIDTLAVIANQAFLSGVDRVQVVMDAQRRQLYAAAFRQDADRGRLAIQDVDIVDDAEWLETLPIGARVMGPGLTRLRSRLRHDVVVEDPATWEPTATSVARLAWTLHQAGQRDDVWHLLPRYYRPSAAEEKRPSATEENVAGPPSTAAPDAAPGSL